MKRPGVLHLTDSLEAGGTERVAVNLANLLPRERFRSFLCTTRTEGVLTDTVAPEVGRLHLARRQRFDLAALRRLVAFIKANDIQILHAHSTSLFTAVLASVCPPYPRVIWHDHFGNFANEARPLWIYRGLTRRVSGVIAVNQALADWARQRLQVPAARVCFIPNFVTAPEIIAAPPVLPGTPGKRIVCVANLRPQKDHLSLLRAFADVVTQEPQAHLLLVGQHNNAVYLQQIQQEIVQLHLTKQVSLLGEQRQVAALLRSCDIGVLSSTSEGLPLALLEYGLAELPVVATAVGQCPEVLAEGQAGMLVPPAAPSLLAAALLTLLRSSELRTKLSKCLRHRVNEAYSANPIIRQICQVYEQVLREHPP